MDLINNLPSGRFLLHKIKVSKQEMIYLLGADKVWIGLSDPVECKGNCDTKGMTWHTGEPFDTEVTETDLVNDKSCVILEVDSGSPQNSQLKSYDCGGEDGWTTCQLPA